MTAPHDFDRQLSAFLMDGPTDLPEPSFDAIRDGIEETRQRVYIGPWRLPTMNKLLPLGLGTAAVVVALVVGGRFVNTPASGGVGGVPSAGPSATASAAPSPTAKPSAAPPSASARSHLLIDFGGVKGTVTVPATGWGGEGGILEKQPNGADAPSGAGMITFTGELYVYGDPCKWSTTKPKTPARTVDELVAALSAQASRDASAPVDVTLDGHAGKSMTLHVPDDAVFSKCDEGYFGSWGGPDEPTPYRYSQGPGQIDELWILDVDGVLTVIDTAYFAGTPAEHVEEMRAIVRSATFE